LRLLGWTIANLVAIGLCWLALLIGDRVIFRNRARRPTSLILVLMFSFLVGVLKGFSTTYLAWLLMVEPDLGSIWSRSAQAGLLGLATIPALAVLAATRLRFQEERDSLVAERVNLAIESDAEASKDAQRAVREVREALAQLSELVRHVSDKQLPPLLHDVVTQQLRPTTYKLWEQENAKERGFSFAALSRLAVLNHPFVATPVALIIGVGSLIPYVVADGWLEGLTRSLISGVVIAIGFALAKLAKFNSFSFAVGYFVVVHVAIASVTVWISSLLFGEMPGYPPLLAAAVLLIWTAQTAFMAGFIKGALVTRDEVRSQLRAISERLGVDNRALRAKTKLVNRNIANHLHGTVQNRILALALRLEQGESLSLQDELDQIQELLSESSNNAVRLSATSLEDIANRWSGIAEIEIVTAGLCSKCLRRPELGALLSEAVNNAVRHGMAQNILAVFECDGDDLIATVTDDGIGPRRGRSGLGSTYFESIARRGWSLTEKAGGGSVLELKL
jgi:two-component sensor histidine kinase